MSTGNQTYLTEFILLGLSSDQHTQVVLFAVFLVVYLLTVLGNLLIMVLLHFDSRLHTPMYFFLKNLSFVDLCFSTVIVPQMLFHLVAVRKSISFTRCSAQMFFFLVVGCTESSLLAVMSYDRYIAVCKPLHYSTLMNQRICVQLVLASWTCGALVSVVDTSFTLCLPYRGQNIINHYFCEPPALLKLASEETYRADMAIFAMGVLILLGPVSLILFSYWNVISTVVWMRTGEGRLKVFSTCGSHLIVVILIYGSTIFTYMQPNTKKKSKWDKMVSVFYSVITSMLNPFIYSLRNKDVKEAFKKVFGR
ncbi:olfactory receptor 2D3-like [Erinaceus europaeus]|uniref:Olfactory receptor n=1 Tax=Erinaceus europaeus TaxID=9365 RepID=A0A1S3A1G5_ERIEU|nr:olfactory receptor 2D3-like [Erinaceus europaeus]